VRRVSSLSLGQVAHLLRLQFRGQPERRFCFSRLSVFGSLHGRFRFRIGTPKVHTGVPKWDRQM